VFTSPPKADGRRGTHRTEGERSFVGGRVAAVVVAAGALATTAGIANGFGVADQQVIPLAGNMDLAAALASGTAGPAPVGAETVHVIRPGFEAAKLVHAEQLQVGQHVGEALKHAQDGYAARQQEAQRVADEEAATQARVAAEEAAKRPKFVKPAEGSFTSGFGGRWGTTHYGVDIANAIGTPILSVADGVVVEAGPASGFGLWVRVQHADGTITVYGHMNEILVSQGQQVGAGQQIATIGNRGQSTGPHLHFEVWLNGSQKIDPLGWLGERGISL
jgi:murein DD-endopeptidase MepM/ murein hydrolase activator NlpD